MHPFGRLLPAHTVRRAPRAPGQPLHLAALSLSLRSLDDRPGPVRTFLLAFVGVESSTEEALWAFVQAVWPSGLPATFVAANVANEGAGHLRLLLRPPVEGPRAGEFGRSGFTLALVAYRRQGKLVVSDFEVTPHVQVRGHEVALTGVVHWNEPDRYMTAEDLDRIGTLAPHRAMTKKRLVPWRKYLEWMENLVHQRQTEVPYLAWRWAGEARIAFLVAATTLPEKRLLGLELGAAEAAPDDEEEDEAPATPRRRMRAPQLTELGEVEQIAPVEGESKEGWGQVKPTDRHRTVVIRLDEDDAKRLTKNPLPLTGRLMSSIAGDLGPLRNQASGISRLESDQGFCLRLADFVFDARSAGVALEAPAELPAIPGGRSLNPGQREAVQKALAAPDLCLIQGPPGTGKTTVIADICLRAAHAGQRVLVASQTNLAVDNALARLSDQPVVRRLRLGDPGRIDEEFKDFLAENVISRWFASIAEQCKQRIAAGEAARRATAQRRADLDELVACGQQFEEQLSAQDELDAESEQAHRHWLHWVQEVEALGRQHQAAARVAEAWRGLAAWAAGEGGLRVDLEGVAVDEPRLRALAASSDRIEPLRVLVNALEALESTAAGQTTPEILELRREKARLADSESETDLRRLGEVNRALKRLEQSGWSQATGRVDRAARAAFGEVPGDLARVVDSLKPSPEVLDLTKKIATTLQADRVAAERAARERGELLAAFQDGAARAAAHLAELERAREEARQAQTSLSADEDRIAADLAALDARREQTLATWERLWTTHLEGEAPEPSVTDAEAAREAWAEDLAEDGAKHERSTRWAEIQGAWTDRLRRISESDRDQLQAIYVRQANVVGMTCNEAGKRKTWQDEHFRPFDIVIIDEVSKATPPELLLPALLGRKVVLVGDHRQLPPMFRERDASFGEAQEEALISPEDFQAYRRMVTASLFEELFEQAPDAIKATLTVQYRMHPQIMDVVNEFYDGHLQPGPDRAQLATNRHHHLLVPDKRGGLLIEPQQHLIWIDSSHDDQGRRVEEEQVGSGKRNLLEVELVVRAVVRIGRALGERGYCGDREVVAAEGGRLLDIVSRQLSEIPQETRDELFAERRVRIAGRAQKPDRQVEVGEIIQVQAKREVGVLTFYGAQLQAIRRLLDEARKDCPEAFVGMDLRTNTVDRFQGMEKAIVVMSLVRAKQGKLGAFVREFQRINVGMSRAQQLLVIVGAAETWRRAQVELPPLSGGPAVERPVYANILAHAQTSGGYRSVAQLFD